MFIDVFMWTDIDFVKKWHFLCPLLNVAIALVWPRLVVWRAVQIWVASLSIDNLCMSVIDYWRDC